MPQKKLNGKNFKNVSVSKAGKLNGISDANVAVR